MEFRLILFLCFWADVAGVSVQELKLQPDQPFESVPISSKATVRCCYNGSYSLLNNWTKYTASRNGTTFSQLVIKTEKVNFTEDELKNGIKCYSLVFSSVTLNDTGLYKCVLTYNSLVISSHGTFLQVYIPLQKTLNLSESVKNSIITAEGVLLLMCVLMPGIMLLCKSKRLNELEKKKGREEENIYEGLNLDECNSAYHQIQRSCQQGPYQDVASCEEDIQLEKP